MILDIIAIAGQVLVALISFTLYGMSRQIARMFSAHQDEAGVARTEGHGSWFHDNVDWLISAWVAARVQISGDHTMQRRTLMTFWGNRDTKEHVLGLLKSEPNCLRNQDFLNFCLVGLHVGPEA